MKKALIGVFGVLITFIVILIVFTLQGRSARETELENALTSSMEKAIDVLDYDRIVAPQNEEEWIAMFLETLTLQIDSDSELTVNVLAADMKKGLLSVEAILTFKHPIGTTGHISCTKTIIKEHYDAEPTPKTYTIQFMVEGKPYKTFTLQEGSSYLTVIDPIVNGKTFEGWKTADGTIVDITNKTVTESVVYYAIFN